MNQFFNAMVIKLVQYIYICIQNFGCVVIVIIKFVDQDIIESLSCFSYIYMYIYMHSRVVCYPKIKLSPCVLSFCYVLCCA